jgi:predicted membrane-bound mannosyltransferase
VTTIRPRGSTLVLVVVLLAVLAAIGVAAVSLGSQERVNAAAKGRRDALAACAGAARLALWAELARYGSGYLTSSSPGSEIVLADGTRLAAPAHYSSAGTDGQPVAEIIDVHQVQFSHAGTTNDLTNRMDAVRGGGSGTAYVVNARCKDPKGREVEVEFTTALAL